MQDLRNEIILPVRMLPVMYVLPLSLFTLETRCYYMVFTTNLPVTHTEKILQAEEAGEGVPTYLSKDRINTTDLPAG